jgi:hypothetical protein
MGCNHFGRVYDSLVLCLKLINGLIPLRVGNRPFCCSEVFILSDAVVTI